MPPIGANADLSVYPWNVDRANKRPATSEPCVISPRHGPEWLVVASEAVFIVSIVRQTTRSPCIILAGGSGGGCAATTSSSNVVRFARGFPARRLNRPRRSSGSRRSFLAFGKSKSDWFIGCRLVNYYASSASSPSSFSVRFFFATSRRDK